ncbi:J domain-containing protein [Pseudomonas syringae]|uniref:J domain-containing protein n=1 Tax=Pseudomonas syringae TaxID=317 RepID=UPI001F3F3365|nr:J domain-containing protein [Pseudomonas syringae]MCF5700873.1 J domain-containing protein [Pseudomonas syringae]
MDCWSVLHLHDDAETRDIKRAYARLLKTFRPDEDAEGFQRLREAYEQALAIAQWRLENAEPADEEDVAVATASSAFAALALDAALANKHSHLQDQPWDVAAPEFLTVSPAAPEPFVPPERDELLRVEPMTADRHVDAHAVETQAAQQLLEGLSPDNLDERWDQAQQQGCAKAFERLLLQLCFEQPQLRAPVLHWAVEQLGWLGPWQDVLMNDHQRGMFAESLMSDYRSALQSLLESQSEREFLNLLKRYSAQPWLQVFDRREQWQQTLLHLLNDTEWSVPLFDRIGQLFGWDHNKGLHPQPDWLWETLIERCDQESFYDNLRAKAESDRTWAADVQAAHLLINPLKPLQQKKIIDGFGQNEWQACHDLSEKLTWRFPELLARLPYADVFYWRRFFPRPIAGETWVRVWMAIALALFLQHLPSQEKTAMHLVFIPMLFACVPVLFFRFALSWWVVLTSYVIVPDLWLTEGLIPRKWNPDTRWLVIRHGVPQGVMVLLFSLMLGPLGALTYVGTLLIGLVHKRRIGSLDPELSQRRPWLTALHWAHFSPLQLLFLVVMTAITAASRLGFSLNPLMPG